MPCVLGTIVHAHVVNMGIGPQFTVVATTKAYHMFMQNHACLTHYTVCTEETGLAAVYPHISATGAKSQIILVLYGVQSRERSLKDNTHLIIIALSNVQCTTHIGGLSRSVVPKLESRC